MSHPKIAFCLVALLPVLTLSAQAETSTRPPTAQAGKAHESRNEADKTLASWLSAGCNNQVAIARIGVRKAQSVEVKQFAQKMLDDHAQLGTKLQPFTGTDAKVGSAPVADRKTDGADKSPHEAADASTGRSPVAKGGFDHIALITDLSKRCLEAQSKVLESKSDADFDQSFMQAQVAMHDQAIIMVEVFGNYASDELRPTLKQAGDTLRVHLEQAKTLCKKCESGAKTGKPLNNQK